MDVDANNYYIMNDIDMKGYECTTKRLEFIGTLDGQGHTISNLVIKGTRQI